MLTPLPRVRPWDLASRAVTLDRFSGGRLQIAVGLGGPHQGWTASLARAARWDGIVPTVLGDRPTDPGGGIPTSRARAVADPDELARVLAPTRALREAARLAWEGYDVVVEGGPAPSGEQVRAWAEAGATWWVGADWEATSRADLERQVAAGPPR